MNWQEALALAVILLVPVLPAFILFKYLPSDTSVEGPFQQLRIKLGGAFGAYFLVVLVEVTYALPAVRAREYDTWRVTGQVQLTAANGQPIPSITSVLVSVRPPDPSAPDPEGKLDFNIPIPVVHGNASGQPPPDLVVSCNGYVVRSVTLDPDGAHVPAYNISDLRVDVDTKNHRMVLNHPIVLVPAPATPGVATKTEIAIPLPPVEKKL